MTNIQTYSPAPKKNMYNLHCPVVPQETQPVIFLIFPCLMLNQAHHKGYEAYNFAYHLIFPLDSLSLSKKTSSFQGEYFLWCYLVLIPALPFSQPFQPSTKHHLHLSHKSCFRERGGGGWRGGEKANLRLSETTILVSQNNECKQGRGSFRYAKWTDTLCFPLQ